MYSTRCRLLSLIARLKLTSLPAVDIENADYLVDQDEGAIALDCLAGQLYEYGVTIDSSILDMIASLARDFGLSVEKYSYLRELVGGPCQELDGSTQGDLTTEAERTADPDLEPGTS